MKKLLLTSALAGSLLVSVSASAEMKIKGYVRLRLVLEKLQQLQIKLTKELLSVMKLA